MAQEIETLAGFVARTRWNDVPESVQRHAKLVFLDTLGVILAGSKQPEVQKLQEKFQATAGRGATVLARGLEQNDPRSAALLNGTAGRSIELCEGHRFVSCQAAVQVLPGILATGEFLRRNGSEMLTALVLAYEVSIRLGAALRQRALAHQNGQTALVGAAAGGAYLRQFDAARISRSMRIAATFMLTPSYTNAVAGATTLNAAGGMCGMAAILAPEMAEAGFLAQDDAIEEALAHLVGDGYEPAGMLDELGERWEITRNSFRLRACCNPMYASLEAFEEALADLGAGAGDIERVEGYTYRFASAMNSQNPRNGFASKYSFPHAAAAIALRGNAGYGSFTEEFVADPAVIELRRRITLSHDPALDANFPRIKPARVTVTLKDGRQTTRSCDSPRGDFQRPYEESEIREKFRELAGLVLTEEGVAEVENAVQDAENWKDFKVLTDLLRRHQRA